MKYYDYKNFGIPNVICRLYQTYLRFSVFFIIYFEAQIGFGKLDKVLGF